MALRAISEQKISARRYNILNSIYTGGADPYFEYTTLLLPGNGANGAQNNTFLDSSSNNFTITRNGNTTQGTFSPFSQTGWGNYFNGTNANLKIANNAAFQFGTTLFTIEFWVYFNSTTGRQQMVGCYQNSSTGFIVAKSSGNVLISNLSGDEADITGTTTLQVGTWYHVALSGTGGTSVKLFLNGIQEGSTFTGSTSLSPGSYPFTIGSFAGGGFGDTEFVNGYISNLRVLKGTALYTSNFTPPTSPLTAITNTTILTCQSNRFVDNSSNNFTLTITGSPSVQAFSPFNPSASWSAATYGGSGYFDGNGDYLSVADNTALDLGSGNWTLECWVYLSSLTNANIFFKRSSVLANAYASIYLNVSSNNFYYGVANSAGNGWQFNTGGSTTVVTNTFYHVAMVRNGGTFTAYVNGVVDLTASLTTAVFNNTQAATIGYDPYFNTSMTGYLSSLRLVKGTAVYTSAFTPPTAPLTATQSANTNGNPSAAITGSATSLLLNFTNSGIYDATSKNDLETVGDAKISTAQSKWGGSSMYFDGTGDYLQTLNSNLFNFETGDFTIECWVYLNGAPSTTASIIDTRSGDTASSYIFYTDAARNLTFLWASPALTSSATITASQWVHVAVTRASGTVRLFIGGNVDANTRTSVTGSINASASPLIGSGKQGGGIGYALNAYMQDLRVTKGYARYTTNFTAPTERFSPYELNYVLD